MINKILAGVDEVGRGCLAGPVISCALILRKSINKKFLKDSSHTRHFPALGEATISGLMVNADEKTGLAKKVEPIIVGGVLESRI